MPIDSTPAAPGDPASFRDALNSELERSRGSLRFPRGLEARYQAEHAELRAAELRALSVKGAALFFVFGLFINIALVEDATRWIGLAATVICPPIVDFRGDLTRDFH